MTTESKQGTRSGVSVLLGAGAAALVVGTLLVLVGAVASGTPAAYGALTGILATVLVLGAGALLVNLAAGLAPAASLLVALLTYTLQVLVLALFFVILTRSGLLDDALDRRWLAAAVIAGTLVWLVAQVVLHARVRIPAFESPVQSPVQSAGQAPPPEAPGRPEASAR